MAWAIRQVKSIINPLSGASVTLTLSLATLPGSLLIACLHVHDNTLTVTGVTEGVGGAPFVQVPAAAFSSSAQPWMGDVWRLAPSVGGTTAIVGTFNASTSLNKTLLVYEVVGLTPGQALTTVVQAAATPATGVGHTDTGQPVTTAASTGGIVVGFCVSSGQEGGVGGQGSNPAAGNPFTAGGATTILNNPSVCALLNPGPQTSTPVWTDSNTAQQYQTVTCAFVQLVVPPGQPGLSVELSGLGMGYTAITGDLCDTPMTTTRGFQSGHPDDLVAAPGTCTFVLDNSVHNSGGLLGYYSVDSGSCRAGWTLGIRAQLTIVNAIGTYVVFQGWIDDIAPVTGVYEDQTVVVTAVGWLAHALGTGITAIATPIAQRGDQLTASLQALVTFQPPAISFAAGADTYPLAFDDLNVNRSTVVDGLDYVTRSGFDRVFEQADGTLVFEARATRQASVTPTITLSDVPGANTLVLRTQGLDVRRTRATLLNRFELTVHPRTVDLTPVVLAAAPISASSPSVPPGTALTVQLPYTDPTQRAQSVGGVNMLIYAASGIGPGGPNTAIGTSGSLPTADWHFTTSPNGLGTSMDASMTVTVVYAATQATLTITNSGSATAYVALLQVRGNGIYDYLDVVGLATQSTSQAAVGQTVYPVDCPYQVVPQFAQLAATWCATMYAASLSQITKAVVFIPNTDTASLALALSLDISSPVWVTETLSGLAAMPCWINGVALEIDARTNVTVTYGLVPMYPATAPGAIPWLLGIAGRTELGSTTELGAF